MAIYQTAVFLEKFCIMNWLNAINELSWKSTALDIPVYEKPSIYI